MFYIFKASDDLKISFLKHTSKLQHLLRKRKDKNDNILHGNKKNFPLETKQEYQLSSAIQQNPSSLSAKHENQTTLGNQADDSGPKICAIFSLKNESKIRKDSGKKEEQDNDEEEEEVVQIGGGIFEEVAEGEDEESIEEFDPEDPEDPTLLEDEEEEEEEKAKDEQEEEESSRSLKTVYKYDMAADSYVRVEGNEEGVCVKSESSQISENENQREGMRQPNILKRKWIMPTVTAKNEGEDDVQSMVEGSKMQKLDTNNLLNTNNPPEEDGIIYVTLKGSKPNEILLVKVSV